MKKVRFNMLTIRRRIFRKIWNNGLMMVFLTANIFPLITTLCVEVPVLDSNRDKTGAILYIVACLVMTLIGYALSRGGGYFISIKERKKYFPLMVFLSLFGAFIAYKTLSSVSSIEALQSMMVEGEDVTSLREEMGAGGISGVFKMFACMPY